MIPAACLPARSELPDRGAPLWSAVLDHSACRNFNRASVGYNRSVTMTGSRSFEGLLDSETSGMADSCFSAFAVVGIQRFVRPCASQLLFSHWPKSIRAFHRIAARPDLNRRIASGLFNSQFWYSVQG
jgi:hypothetical protein